MGLNHCWISIPMSDLFRLELTDRQCELLLRGLRFVRSSRMLETREIPDPIAEERRTELGEIRQLLEMLDPKGEHKVPARQ